MITIENQNGRKNSRGRRMWDVDVRLDGKLVGVIKSCATGFYYVPNANPKMKGEIFDTLRECRQSLES